MESHNCLMRSIRLLFLRNASHNALFFPSHLRRRRCCGWMSSLRELPMSGAARRWKILTFTADLFYIRHPLSRAAKDVLDTKTLAFFTYLGGDLRIQHWQAHIQNRCYPTEEQFDFPLPTLDPDTRVLEHLALGTEDDKNGFNLRL